MSVDSNPDISIESRQTHCEQVMFAELSEIILKDEHHLSPSLILSIKTQLKQITTHRKADYYPYKANYIKYQFLNTA